MEACNSIKKDTLVQVFSREFCKMSKNIFFTEYLQMTASVHYQCRFTDWSPQMSQMSQGLRRKFLKFTRIVNAINLRKFKNPISWFEIELPSFSSFSFSISFDFTIFHSHFWLSVIIRATMRQRTNTNKASNIK